MKTEFEILINSFIEITDKTGFTNESNNISDLNSILNILGIDRSINPAEGFIGGNSNASQLLQDFIDKKLDEYHEKKNDPTMESTSNLSPYLHFGQVSPLYIALKVLEDNSPGEEAFLEELIVRRELSMNFIFYNHNYVVICPYLIIRVKLRRIDITNCIKQKIEQRFCL